MAFARTFGSGVSNSGPSVPSPRADLAQRKARSPVPSFFLPCWRIVIFISVLLLGVACAKRGSPDLGAPVPLIIATSEGIDLAATFYPVAKSGAPGLVLVHGLGDTRQTWRPLIERARQEGFACLAFDLRGHGESVRQKSVALDYREFNDAAWQSICSDIGAAKRALIDHGGGDANIAILGAGLGANLALRYSASDPEVAAIALLSPGLKEHGFDAEQDLTAFGHRPVLLMTAQDDSYSASACATLKQQAPGFCELRSYAGSARGANLLAASPNALEQVVGFLEPILKSSKPAVPAS